MPVHSQRHVINNKTLHLLAVTYAIEATTQETHCCCTRPVPRCVLVHARAQPASCNHQQNTTFISSDACSRGDDTGDTLQLHKARTKARASSMPMHSQRHVIINKAPTFISSHACSRGDDTGHTLYLHKACTKARASSMPVHSQCHVIINKTLHLSAFTRAKEATTQETTTIAQGTYQGACLIHASAQPASCNHQQNTYIYQQSCMQ